MTDPIKPAITPEQALALFRATSAIVAPYIPNNTLAAKLLVAAASAPISPQPFPVDPLSLFLSVARIALTAVSHELLAAELDATVKAQIDAEMDAIEDAKLKGT